MGTAPRALAFVEARPCHSPAGLDDLPRAGPGGGQAPLRKDLRGGDALDAGRQTGYRPERLECPVAPDAELVNGAV
jgi:hypothetical protein